MIATGAKVPVWISTFASAVSNWIEHHQGLASWIQGIGTIAAIILTIYLTRHDEKTKNKKEFDHSMARINFAYMSVDDLLEEALKSRRSLFLESGRALLDSLKAFADELVNSENTNFTFTQIKLAYGIRKRIKKMCSGLEKALEGTKLVDAKTPAGPPTGIIINIAVNSSANGMESEPPPSEPTLDGSKIVVSMTVEEHLYAVWNSIQSIREGLQQSRSELDTMGPRI